MTRNKKIIIGVSVAVFVIAIICVIASSVTPKNSNKYFTVTESFSVSQASTFSDHVVTGRVQNNTNQELKLVVTLKTPFTSYNSTFYVTIPANSSSTINGSVSYMAHRISSVVLETNGKTYTFKTDDADPFDDGPPSFIFILPFIITPIIFVIVIIVGVTRGSFSHLTNRLQHVNTRIASCSQTNELEKLKREKQHIENELAKFVICEYCGAKNVRTELKCHGCGAPIKH